MKKINLPSSNAFGPVFIYAEPNLPTSYVEQIFPAFANNNNKKNHKEKQTERHTYIDKYLF